MAQAVAGWYPDPSGATGKRYWDGTTWTESADALPKKAYTSWISRIVAAIADLFVFGIVARGPNALLNVVQSKSCTTDPVTGSQTCTLGGTVITWIVLLAVLAFLIWNLFYRQGTTGSSIGKSLLKFKVVSERTGQPIGFGLSVVRFLAHVLDLIYFIGFLLPLFTAKRQTIADMIMKTVCVPIEATLAPAQQPPERPSRTLWIIGGAAAVVVWIVAVVAVVFTGHQAIVGQHTSPTASTSQTTPTSQASQTFQVVLPFTGLNQPVGVAADTAGTVYVTDSQSDRVVKLAAGSSTPTVLPFTGLAYPTGVAVDNAGTVYVADTGNSRVLKLAAGATTPDTLPLTGLTRPQGVAVDTAGTVYVMDNESGRVVKLAAGSSTQTELPFTGLKGPEAVAVDTAGAVYVADFLNNRVVKLAAGASTPAVLPFTDLDLPRGVAVDTAGNVYVTSGPDSRVVKLAGGSSSQTVLPSSLDNPTGVAVDAAGIVYVADEANNRVVKLLPG